MHGLADAPRGGVERRVGLAVDRSGEHRARCVEQFDHRVEAGARFVDVDPGLGAGIPEERVDVDVRSVVVGDPAVHLEAEPPVLVAALLLCRVRRVGAGGKVGREHAERLGGRQCGIDIDATGGRLLGFLDNGDVAVVGVRVKRQAAPVTGRRRGRAVVAGVLDSAALWIDARPDSVVVERREHHGVARLPHDLNGATDPVLDVELIAGGGEARVGPRQLHDKARIGPAHEPEARRRVEVLDDDFALQHVHDVGVVPDALDGDLLAADHEAADRAGDGVKRQPVAPDKRTAVVVVAPVTVDATGAPSRVGQLDVAERVGVDRDHGARVAAEVVVEDHRLGPADEDRRGGVATPAPAGRRRGAAGVALDAAVGHTEIALVGFDDVELVERSLDRSRAATVSDVGVVDARLGAGVEHDAAPVAGGADVGQVAIRVERAAGPVAVIAEAREHDPLGGRALRDELRGAPFELDPRALQLHNDARVDRQPAALAGFHASYRVEEITPHSTVDEEIFLEHVDDVGALEAGGHVELVERLAEVRADLHEQAVGRVLVGRDTVGANLHEPVAADLWPHAAVRVFEAVGVGGDRGAGAVGDRVEGDRGPRALELDWGEWFERRVDEHLAAAVADRRIGDRVDEGLLGGGVGILPQHDAAPLAAVDVQPDVVGVSADEVVVVGAEDHVAIGGAENLDSGPGAIDQLRRTADVDDRGPQLDHRVFVDEHGDVLRHVEGRAIRQGVARKIGAHEVGQRHAERAGSVADDPHDRSRRGRRDRILDAIKRLAESAIGSRRIRGGEAGIGGLVDEERSVGRRVVRGSGRLEPEVERPARLAVAVAVEERVGRGRSGQRGDCRAPRLKAELEPVVARGAAAVARVAHLGIERRVAGARDGDEVGARLEIEPDERIAAIVIVVAGDQLTLARVRVLTVKRNHAVELAGHHLARTGDHGLGGKGAGRGEREAIRVDVGTDRGIELRKVDGVVVARKYRFAGETRSHDRRNVVGVLESERVADLVHRDDKIPAAVLAGAPVEERVHDRYCRAA